MMAGTHAINKRGGGIVSTKEDGNLVRYAEKLRGGSVESLDMVLLQMMIG
jgi:hypothetical protein